MSRDEYTLDPRTQAELCARVEELAASYTPEWRFDRKNPDIGSTLALIYTGQMADNLRRLNQLPEKYHTEFVNLLGLTLKPAYPASGVAVVELLRGTVPGVALPRGTRLMADGADGDPVVFETEGDVYLTNARITDVLSLSGSRGRILPLLGGPKAASLIPEPVRTEEVSAPGTEPPPEGREEESPAPFALFDYEEPGIEKNALLLYHRSLFGGDGGVPIRLRFTTPEGTPLSEDLTDPLRWRWSYYDGQALHPFAQAETKDGTVELLRDGPAAPLTVEGTDYYLLCLEALGPVPASLTLGDVRCASLQDPAPPERILHGGEELEAADCLPFGDTVSLFDECYLCDDRVFAQQGARLTLSFRLEHRTKLLRLTAEQESEELKIIKRKPRAVQFNTAATAPERVALEYFNGHAWRRLPCDAQWGTVLDGKHGGDVSISFLCPEDWAPVPVNGYDGRSLRLRIIQADNCYLLPCQHTVPVLRDVRLAYDYPGLWKQPQRLRTVRGTRMEDGTRALLEGGPVTAFAPLPYPAAALYLGFDRPLEGAPVSILFEVEENVPFRMKPVTYEYSTRTGFKEMKVLDGTENFSHTGTVRFLLPSDFAPLETEGVRRWWLRLRGDEDLARGYHARVRAIRRNAVDLRNRQTQEEESFYVDAAAANMTFPLAARNILSAEVFVSELGQLSRRQMRQMLEEQPQNVRVEYDFLGEITAFYVRWTEVETFDRSRPGDRHYCIDRVQNRLVFGDGVHVRIPQARPEAAILVRAVSCDGSRGNVPAGAIDRFYGNVMYVQSVSNPAATYAGSDLEDLDSARRRGAELLSSRDRLISSRDFVRAVRAFSGAIEKVRCVTGRDIDGQENPALITIALMTRDYREGGRTFHDLREPLRRRLLSRCAATVTSDCLVLSEPMYVEISVSVWVRAEDAARAFDVRDKILRCITDFLDPLSRPGHPGWDIGTLPTEGQLRMLLQSLRFPGHVARMIAVARYTDRTGIHETGLDQLPHTPFTIGVSGQHQVHIEFQ